jgi:multisubunit Na+/H+ antiporter MnhF subunit
VNAWLWAGTVLLLGLVPLGIVCLRAPLLDAVVALELAGIVVTLVLLVLAEGFARSVYFELSLVLAVVTLAGSLAYVRFFERWL